MECVFCNCKLKSNERLEVHYRTHIQESPYHCSKCPAELKSKGSLNYHLNTHLPRAERELECHLCGKLLVSKSQLMVHIQAHEGKTKYECKICGKKYANESSLKTHKNRHKNWKKFAQRERFQCDQCPKGFLTKTGYEEHCLIHQDKEFSFQCDKCEQRFLNLRKLKVHKSYYHLEKTRVFSCIFCEKQFPKYYILEDHLASHTFERPHLCRLCPAEFRHSASLARHKAVHLKQRTKFRCDMCLKLFVRKESLNTHIREHIGELHYKCERSGCDLRFNSNYRLNHHILKIHVGKQFPCNICEKKFLTKRDLNSHAFTHTNLRRYHCNVCDRAFKQLKHLTAHGRTIHGQLSSL